MNPAGVWDLSLSTPIGRLAVVVELREEAGAWSGTASGAGDEVELRDIAVEENRVVWKQSITKPMRLNLAFDVVVEGDSMTGASRAGRLPSSKVAGQRRAGA
ncbi:hypothetical protein [Nonomuraea sp. JJY05]|jgi:hypothetical protein|uniref:hypothetical protein n=1 Tax=Nonomuraea sp. JJY05 TaxID=3350255 RepID=UPI00373F5A9B